ncbi:pentapeptide repeat-containing protein [Actinophytocola sp.]|uniref:pentapeptide repeat-containing protein n=1 Tax=Actinophytocola sp. TaxID=1872138 RepID=UPI0039C8AFDD
MRARPLWFWLVVASAIGIGVLVVVLVRIDGSDLSEALKTGGLAAGAMVALYALWLNDRRRRVEENRHSLETQRAQHDRERVADERFARAVELLGNEADQVRVGAMHALAGLARSRPGYTQTVLDVLCAYLRRPFDHYRYAEVRGDKARTWDAEETRAADRELQVRMTAQRLIADLLPAVSDEDSPIYDLDLHGATLEFFSIENRVVGQIRARETKLYEATRLSGAVVRGPVWFTRARCWGRLYANDTVFHDRSWFNKLEALGKIDFTRAEFHHDTRFAHAVFHGPVSFRNARFAGGASVDTTGLTVPVEQEHNLPDGWRDRGVRAGPGGN